MLRYRQRSNWYLVLVLLLCFCCRSCIGATTFPSDIDRNDPHNTNSHHHPQQQIQDDLDPNLVDDETDADSSSTFYYIGTGIYDMTGPAAQINFMGYAKGSQTGHGIHLRLRSRAFIMSQVVESTVSSNSNLTKEGEEEEYILQQQSRRGTITDTTRKLQLPGFLRGLWNRNKRTSTLTATISPQVARLDPDNTVCFVSVDIGMGSDLLTKRVVQRLEELLPEQHSSVPHSSRRLCHLENLSISGTHTHSAPAGFLQYTLYQITSKGFSTEAFDTYVESIAQSILRAYRNLQPGSIEIQQDKLHDANINRSPTSYLLNPQSERDTYQEDGDTDKSMLQLLFSHHHQQQHDNHRMINEQPATPIGLLNWFAVHGTSMNGTNTLISGDNKGFASYLMEKRMNGPKTLPGQGGFVAAFASTNLGDVSPNTNGPRCLDTGEPCDLVSSTCNGKSELCVAFGPGKDMEESTEIIGRKQFELAHSMMKRRTVADRNSTSYHPLKSIVLQGPIASRHAFIDMANTTVTLESGEVVKTCPAALGYGFAAGTTDGPGMFDFAQGQNTSNPFWNLIGGFLSPPSKEQKECHHPKPILLNTGEASLPYSWDPKTVPISVFRVGQLLILNVPCELTTMAGRRLRRAISTIAKENGMEDPEITIAGLANSYTHYVTTVEEYAGQRYEAASTLYGPHTLSAYIQEFRRLTTDLLQGTSSTSDDPPEDLQKKQLSFISPVMVDAVGIGQPFGSVANDCNDHYRTGDTVHVSFRSANPRNNQRIEGTFMTVDHLQDDGSWMTVYVDGDWCTKYVWRPLQDVGTILGISFAELYWNVPQDQEQGIYRICHYGTRKTWMGNFEWVFLHLPESLSTDLFGSMAAGVILQGMRFFARVSERFGMTVESWMETFGRTKDFDGCSRSFLVSKTSS
ncbi:neutral/alkaline non-lysosomal ceramidase [Nitzschia inconspicua]|uniref:Neutral ceramidase n=1 Tax=Nitzschia inconspicua TaxID=303405 RepID=A0A9K3K9S3_9STRA|nr:neutral/alkaline non-lysosomal ceramidase [Nitzschia inconspicua]KAG7362407.1 neutral/alkaline non-lysosomal ceramidase [Nitzschia inconspicua]